MHNEEKETEDWVRKAYLDTPLENSEAKKKTLDAIKAEFMVNSVNNLVRTDDQVTSETSATSQISRASQIPQASHTLPISKTSSASRTLPTPPTSRIYNSPRFFVSSAAIALACTAVLVIVLLTNRNDSTNNSSLNQVYAESTGSGLASSGSGNRYPQSGDTGSELSLSQKQLSEGGVNSGIESVASGYDVGDMKSENADNAKKAPSGNIGDIKVAASNNNEAANKDIKRTSKDAIQDKQPSLDTKKTDGQLAVEDDPNRHSQTEVAKHATTNNPNSLSQSLQKLDQKTAIYLAHLVDSAASLNLPTSALTLRIQEGVKRGAKSDRIAVVANNYMAALSTARSGLGHQVTQDEVELGAEAVLAGASQAGLRELRAARPKGSLSEPLLALTDMASHGVPVRTAGSAIASVMSSGGTDINVRAFRTSVVGDIIKGVPPESALTKSLQKQQLPKQHIRKDQTRDSLKHKDVIRP